MALVGGRGGGIIGRLSPTRPVLVGSASDSFGDVVFCDGRLVSRADLLGGGDSPTAPFAPVGSVLVRSTSNPFGRDSTRNSFGDVLSDVVLLSRADLLGCVVSVLVDSTSESFGRDSNRNPLSDMLSDAPLLSRADLLGGASPTGRVVSVLVDSIASFDRVVSLSSADVFSRDVDPPTSFFSRDDCRLISIVPGALPLCSRSVVVVVVLLFLFLLLLGSDE